MHPSIANLEGQLHTQDKLEGDELSVVLVYQRHTDTQTMHQRESWVNGISESIKTSFLSMEKLSSKIISTD